MGFQLQGKIVTVFDTVEVSARFTKREFVLETPDRYPQAILFQATGDRCSQLDDLREGDEVKVEFSVRGREWRSPKGELKYFNSLDVWKVERVGSQQSLDTGRGGSGSKPSSSSPPASDEDIPF